MVPEEGVEPSGRGVEPPGGSQPGIEYGSPGDRSRGGHGEGKGGETRGGGETLFRDDRKSRKGYHKHRS